MTRILAIVSVPAAAVILGLAACAESDRDPSANVNDQVSADAGPATNGAMLDNQDNEPANNRTDSGDGAANGSGDGNRSGDGNGDDEGQVVVTGVLTEEGVECPALRGDNGRLYTLAGSTGTYGPGDRVKVRGARAEMSICQQGTTISVRSIEAA